MIDIYIVCVGYRREQPSEMEGNGEAGGTHGGAEGTIVSSRPSVDVDVYEGQDHETVTGWGTNLGGVAAETRTKVNHRIPRSR